MNGRLVKPVSAVLLLNLGFSLGACSGGGSSGGGGSSSSSSSSSGGSSSSSGGVAMCPNIPLANGLIGQTSYTLGAANTNGPSASTLNAPQGALSQDGATWYLADTLNNRILGYSAAASTGIAGAAGFVIGQPNAQSTAGGTGPVSGSPISFSNPEKASVGTVGGTSYLVVADSGNNRVLIWNKLPTANTAPDVVLGQPDFTSGDANHPNATVSASSLSHPTAAVIGSKGQLIVVDNLNSRVLIWNAVPTVNGTPADIELGQNALASLSSDPEQTANCTSNNPASPGTSWCFTTNIQSIDQPIITSTPTYNLAMRLPSDVWTDGAHLLVSDTYNNRVLFWSSVPNSMNLLAAAVIGANQFGTYTPAGGSGTTGMSAPFGVASDGRDVFVGDSNNNRVLEFANYLSAPASGASASDVFGQSDFTHNTADDPDQNALIGDQRTNPATDGITAGTMDHPTGVFATSSNDLFVTDSNNNRVLHFAISSGVDGTENYIPCSP